MDKQLNSDKKKCMNHDIIVMAEVEFMFGPENQPQPCIKFPISVEAALFAVLISEALEHAQK